MKILDDKKVKVDLGDGIFIYEGEIVKFIDQLIILSRNFSEEHFNSIPLWTPSILSKEHFDAISVQKLSISTSKFLVND